MEDCQLVCVAVVVDFSGDFFWKINRVRASCMDVSSVVGVFAAALCGLS